MRSYRSMLHRISSAALVLCASATLAHAQAPAAKGEMKMDKMDHDKMGKHESAMKHEGMAMEEKEDGPKMKWGPGPDFLPKGAKMHVASGNPGAAGPFVAHLQMPNGYTIRPHNHPTDEHVKVLSGTFLYAMGDKLDRKAMKTMKVGEDGNIPAKMNHYAAARGKTVIEISGTGPFQITYVNAKDDPRNAKKK